jgi:hypothetical protein
VWLAEEDRNQAPARLAALPDDEAISRSAVSEILAGGHPLVWQRALVQRRYFQMLAGTPIVRGFEVSRVVRQDGRGDAVLHGLDWAGLDESSSAFAKNSMVFAGAALEPRPVPIDETSDLYRALKLHFRQPIEANMQSLGTVPGVRPLSLFRFRIGPYFDRHSANPPELARLVDATPGGFLLKLSIEHVASRDAPASVELWERSLGLTRPVEAATGDGTCRVIVCSPGIAGRLGPSDEQGRPARVFAIDTATGTGEPDGA